jgi:hypothetical protein
MVFATAARHDQTLARRQGAIGAPDSETFKALGADGAGREAPQLVEVKGQRILDLAEDPIPNPWSR